MAHENGNKEYRISDSIKLLLFAVFYFLLCKIGYFLMFPGGTLPVIWLSTGFLYSVVLISSSNKRIHYLAAGLIAGMAADLFTGIGFYNSLMFNISICLTVLLSVILVCRYINSKIEIVNVKEFLIIVVLPSGVVPLLSSLLNKLFKVAEIATNNYNSWENVWFSYAIGFLIFVPFVIAWERKYFQFFRFYKKIEIPIIFILLLVLSVVSYNAVYGDLQISLIEEFIILFSLVIITSRYGIKGTSTGLLVVALSIIIGAKESIPASSFLNEAMFLKFTLLKSLFITISTSLLLFGLMLKQTKVNEFDLMNSNSLLNATLESTENGILTIDLYGTIVMYNKKFLELWNIPADVAETKNDRKLINYILTQLKEPGEFLELVDYLYTHISKESLDIIEFLDGRIFERFSQPQRIEDRIIGRVWSLRDITKQRQAEDALIKSRDAYLKVLDDSPALIWRAGTDAKCDWFNKAWLEFTGRPIEKELGNGWVEGVHPEDLGKCLDCYIASFNKEKPFTMEYRLLNSRGEYRWIIDTGKPNYGLENEFLGYIGYCFDITDRKTAENKIIESEKITSELIANVPEIIVVHVNGVVQFINNTGVEVLGYSIEEVFGKNLKDFFEPDQYAIVIANMIKRTKGEAVEDYEIYLNTKAGLRKNCIVRAVNVNYYGMKAILAILIDITKIKAYERNLEELNETKNKLLSIISHDLKGPFQGFLGVSDLLANQIDTLDKDEIKDMALELNLSLQKQYQLLVEILNWTKMQNNGIKFDPVLLNLNKEIMTAVGSLEGNAIRKEIKININIADGQEVYADPNMLQIILRNLISNAVKFSYRGNSVDILCGPKDNGTEISVIDKGMGIDQDDYEKLFNIKQRFSNDGTENEQGTGLGLIFCKEIVEKHNGTIQCISEYGKGSQFKVFFPSVNNEFN